MCDRKIPPQTEIDESEENGSISILCEILQKYDDPRASARET